MFQSQYIEKLLNVFNVSMFLNVYQCLSIFSQFFPIFFGNQHWNIENIESNSMLKFWKTLTSHWVLIFIFLTSKTLNRNQCQCWCRPLLCIQNFNINKAFQPKLSNCTTQAKFLATPMPITITLNFFESNWWDSF